MLSHARIRARGRARARARTHTHAHAHTQAAGVGLMDEAIRDLEADIERELAQRERAERAAAAAEDACAAASSSSSSTSSSDSDAGTKKKKTRTKKTKSQWRKALDPESGQPYYYHVITKETCWDRPDEYDSEVDVQSWASHSSARAAGVLMGANLSPGDVPTDASRLSGLSSGVNTYTLNGLDPKQILEYAIYIGIEPASEAYLLWIAEDGIQAALPANFTQHTDDKGEVYFYNVETQESSWEHPMDNHYRQLVEYWREAHKRGEKPRDSSKPVHNPFASPFGHSLPAETDHAAEGSSRGGGSSDNDAAPQVDLAHQPGQVSTAQVPFPLLRLLCNANA